MTFKIIPLTSDPDQTFNCTIPVDGKNLKLRLRIRFNTEANYWVMSIYSAADNKLILEAIPLLSGVYPAANILGQFSYLKLGSAFIVGAGNNSMDSPDSTNLGTDFLLVWGDTI